MVDMRKSAADNRDSYKEYFRTPVGDVCWQYSHVSLVYSASQCSRVFRAINCAAIEFGCHVKIFQQQRMAHEYS